MLEVLAIVAYRQPATRAEIEEIRGVDCGGTLRLLLERQMVRIVGKKEEVGRPLLYGTSKYFLEFFQIKSLRELPSLREFTELSEDDQRQIECRLNELTDALTAGTHGIKLVDGQQGQTGRGRHFDDGQFSLRNV